MKPPWRFAAAGLALAMTTGGLGCASAPPGVAPAGVRFHITGVSDVSLGGVDLSYVSRPSELSAAEMMRLTAELERGTFPLQATVHVDALNPDSNPTATLTRLGWTLRLAGRDTSSGAFTDPVDLPSGVTTDVAVPVHVDLARFFKGDARELLGRALNMIGAGGGPGGVSLLARLEVETPYGSIPYPDPILIDSETLP